MKLHNTKLISLLVIILLISVIVGHFLPPTGISLIPLIVTLMTGLIIFTNNDLSILLKSILTYLFIGLNDIGIKLFSGGIHDTEGMGWIHMLLFIGLVPCFIMLIIGVLRDKGSAILIKVLSVLLFILLIFVHLQIFETLGVQEN
ncbi:hypothetical protein GWR56_13450 [Mucilaginibacter sp. 14171R-50]|uniref:hypothetical protein n=1 Tax=Mucilaginibacter sp. 14171R-50 TaxID=2703789 RepID=UPI00138B2F6A|nr:hypothetical protein [Mucilaginibacter sp. 14171R-50]QHS56493.1 hypothetical protein GWR56_13450 [Mucilaginibacter sp. 14171R-50]